MQYSPSSTGLLRYRVLVVISDEARRNALCHNFRLAGLQATGSPHAIDAAQLLAGGGFDVVVADARFPEAAGLNAQSLLRQYPTGPPIVVTLDHYDEELLLRAFDLGAADVVTNPQRIHEVVARARAVLRRSAGARPAISTQGRDSLIVVGPITIDPQGRTVRLGEELLSLTRRAFDLLYCLASPPGRVWTRYDLLDAVWPGADVIDDRTVDQHIRSLRAKIERDPSRPTCLQTVHRVGYRLDCTGECLVRVS